ncbi:MAG: hypothetical protein E4H14_02890, partial [Candidatus Thorarchaeota archaeon]
MAIRRYPGSPNPFVEQKSKIGSKSMGIGAIVFVMVLFGILLAVLYLIPPLMETVVFPDIGIPYSTLFLIFLGCFVLVLGILMFRKGMYVANSTGYKERDPSIVQRVVKDGFDGAEV